VTCVADNEFVFEFKSSPMVYAHWHAPNRTINLLIQWIRQNNDRMPELADAVAQASWTQGRKFLMVPYHVIGAKDMESAILGQYADHVRKIHPEDPIPGFYQAEELFRNAQAFRARLGDAEFFAKLNEGRVAGGGGGRRAEMPAPAPR